MGHLGNVLEISDFFYQVWNFNYICLINIIEKNMLVLFFFQFGIIYTFMNTTLHNNSETKNITL